MTDALRFLTAVEIRALHAQLIHQFGGAGGVLNPDGIGSAVARARQSAFGEEVYPTIYQKAATLIDSFLRNHCFVDGNKRVGLHSAAIFLDLNGILLAVGADEAEALALAVIAGEQTIREIAAWLEARCSVTPDE